jgi:hypothetical protein
MAKSVTRKFLAQFGSTGPTSKFGQFGSLVAGSPVNTKDPLTIQSLTAWLNGIQDALYGANKAPLMEDFNGLLYVAFWQIFYLLQEGVPEWDSSTTYFTGSIVRAPGTGNYFVSLVDTNLNQALPSAGSDNANWQSGFNTPAVRVGNGLVDAQISTVATTKLLGLITDGQMSGMSASKLIGQVADAQISSLSGSKVTGGFPASSISGTLVQSQIGAGAIGTSQLKTGMGSASGNGGGNHFIIMNDYTFFPSMQSDANADVVETYPTTDNGDTVGRFSTTNADHYTHRWRYVTASDDPRIWVVLGKDGKIQHVWESEDPPNHGDVADGFDEIAPFTGDDVIRVPVLDHEQLVSFYNKLSKEVSSHILIRYNRILGKKGWVTFGDAQELVHPSAVLQVVPDGKQAMATHWLFRHIAGNTSASEAILKLCDYSPNDGRLILSQEHVSKVRPTYIAV